MAQDSSETSSHSLSRRHFIGATSVAALAGCLDVTIGDSGETLEFVTARPPMTLDPLEVWDTGSAHIVNQVVEGLYAYDDELQVTPQLATGNPDISRAGTRYVVSIDPDARFPGGDPVLADDVIYSYQTPRGQPTPPGSTFDMLEDITAIDQGTVQFDLTYPYGGFDTTLTWYIVPTQPADTGPVAQGTDNNPTNLVGSGPFEFDKFLETGGIRLTRWDNYWSEPTPEVAGVEFRPVSEGTKRVVTIKASEADVIDEIPPTVWQTLSDVDTVTTDATPGLGYYYFAFNCNEGPTTDPQVREAIDYAVDLDQIIQETVTPVGERIYAPVPPQIATEWDFPTDDWASIPHDRDIERAAMLLDDSDAVPPEWEPRIIVPPDDTRETIAEHIADAIRATGYRARVDRLDWPTFQDTFTTGNNEDYDAYCLGWIDAPDPDRYLHPLFGPQAAGRTDGTYYTSVELLIQSAREADSYDLRRSQYISAIETLLTDRAHLPLYTENQTLAMERRVRDIGTHPRDGFVLVGHGYNVTITDPE